MNPQNLITHSRTIPALALVVFGYLLAQAGWLARVPSDGWLYEQESITRQIRFTQPLTDRLSPLQAGDLLLSADGLTIAQIDATLYTFNSPHSDHWEEGGVVYYTVLRRGQVQELPIPLRRLRLSEIVSQFWASGLADLPPIGFLLVGLISLVIFLKQPNHLAAQLLLLAGAGLTGVALSFFSVGFAVNFSQLPLLGILINPWPLFVHAPLAHLLLIFPEQKRIVREHPRLVLSLLYLSVPCSSLLAIIGKIITPASLNVLGSFIIPFFPLAVMLPSLVHTFRTVREPIAQAQARWVGMGILGLIVLTNIGWIIPGLGGSEWFWVVNVLGYVQLPICLGIAIFRYRLWDIDILIRRTLQYSLLTAMLSLVYFGSVVLLQTIFGSFTDEQSPIVIVLSTLLIAALFTPLRRRVQDVIDRRFFRQKYDAQRVLAAFAIKARDETDLDILTGELTRVVQETIQPEGTIVWLRKP